MILKGFKMPSCDVLHRDTVPPKHSPEHSASGTGSGLSPLVRAFFAHGVHDNRHTSIGLPIVSIAYVQLLFGEGCYLSSRNNFPSQLVVRQELASGEATQLHRPLQARLKEGRVLSFHEELPST